MKAAKSVNGVKASNVVKAVKAIDGAKDVPTIKVLSKSTEGQSLSRKSDHPIVTPEPE